MRPVICALLALIASACSALATTAKVTIILQFDARHSEPSVSEMKRELQSLMQNSGVDVSWRRLDELSASDSFPSVVMVTFHGSCETRPAPATLPSEPVPLAYTHIANGNVIPFADVECDVVRRALGPSASGDHGDLLFGRALGRVLAHELHHIIDRTRAHAQHGISRKSLSARDLIADRT